MENSGWVVAVIILLIITLIKKKKQLGQTWEGEITARLEIAGKELCCNHCGNTQFHKREGILVTSLVCLFQYSFWNRSAACYTCAKCGHIEWFVRATEEKVEISRDPNIES